MNASYQCWESVRFRPVVAQFSNEVLYVHS